MFKPESSMAIELPPPVDTGSSGTQTVESDSSASLSLEPPLHGLPLYDTLRGLASTHPKNMGGTFSAQMVVGFSAQMANDLHEARRDLKEERSKSEQATTDLYAERIKTAQLSAKLAACTRVGHFSKFGIFIGTILVSVGIDILRSPPPSNTSLGWLLLALGVAFVSAAWFVTPKPDQQ